MTPTPPNAGEPVASKSVMKRIAAQSGHVLKTAREVEIWFAAFEAGRAQPNAGVVTVSRELLSEAAECLEEYALADRDAHDRGFGYIGAPTQSLRISKEITAILSAAPKPECTEHPWEAVGTVNPPYPECPHG